MNIDIPKRVYDHTWKLDPIVRSLLDTDFYKLLMLQPIHARHEMVTTRFTVINRSKSVNLAEVIDERELREQLDHARTLRFTKRELIWLGGNTFYGMRQIFRPEFLAWLADFRLPDYDLRDRGRRLRAGVRGALEPRHDVGDARPRHHQRIEVARGDALDGPLRARHPLCPRQGQAMVEDRAAARSSKACASPISAPAGATASCGRAGASRR